MVFIMKLSERVYIKDALKKTGNVVVSGWVERVRLMGNLAFIILRDRTGNF